MKQVKKKATEVEIATAGVKIARNVGFITRVWLKPAGTVVERSSLDDQKKRGKTLDNLYEYQGSGM